eukprot:2705984-Lingulodinium_polyedra.AAC.1
MAPQRPLANRGRHATPGPSGTRPGPALRDAMSGKRGAQMRLEPPSRGQGLPARALASPTARAW